MGKHLKLKSPQRTAPIEGAAGAFDQLEGMYTRAIGGVDKFLQSIEATIDSGTASPALAREAANLVRALNGISAESRAREKQQTAGIRNIELPHVLAWFRSLAPAERAQFLRTAQNIEADAKRSGLS